MLFCIALQEFFITVDVNHLMAILEHKSSPSVAWLSTLFIKLSNSYFKLQHECNLLRAFSPPPSSQSCAHSFVILPQLLPHTLSQQLSHELQESLFSCLPFQPACTVGTDYFCLFMEVLGVGFLLCNYLCPNFLLCMYYYFCNDKKYLT